MLSLPIKRKIPYAPQLLTLLGAGILAAAWPLGRPLQDNWQNLGSLLALLGMLLCFPVLLFLWDKPLRTRTRVRVAVSLLLFGLCFYSTVWPRPAIYITQVIGLVGLALWGAGLWRWPAALRLIVRTKNALRFLRKKPDITAAVIAIAACLASVTLGWVCFKFLPAIVDSNAQYIHAKYMAQGKLYGPEPPIRKFFPVWMTMRKEKFYAQYQPLHIMLLAIGHLIHAPWMVNPFGIGLGSFLTYCLGKRVFGTTTGLLAAALLAASPFVLFMGAEYMNHGSCIWFTALFMLSFVACFDAIRAGNQRAATWWGLAAGFGLGGILLIRPLTSVGLGLPFVCYAAWKLKTSPHTYGKPFIAAFASSFACLLFLCWYNNELTGNPFMLPTSAYHENNWQLAMGLGHDFTTPAYALEKARGEWWLMNLMAFEWPVPCLLLLLCYLLRPARKNTYATLLLASIASHITLNMLNQFTNVTFGPRYMFEAMVPFVILSAAGLQRLPVLLRQLPAAPSRQSLSALCYLSVAGLFVFTAIYRMPARIKEYGNHYMDNAPDFYQQIVDQCELPALVFMSRNKTIDIKNFYVQSRNYRRVSFLYPHTDADPIIFAYDYGNKEDQRLVKLYPGRNNYYEENGKLYPLPDPQSLETAPPDAKPANP